MLASCPSRLEFEGSARDNNRFWICSVNKNFSFLTEYLSGVWFWNLAVNTKNSFKYSIFKREVILLSMHLVLICQFSISFSIAFYHPAQCPPRLFNRGLQWVLRLHSQKCTIWSKPAADLYQRCFNNWLSRCVGTSCPHLVGNLSTVRGQLATKLLKSRSLLQVVPTATCYLPAIQQLVKQLVRLAAKYQYCYNLLQACYKALPNTSCCPVVRFLSVPLCFSPAVLSSLPQL